jgi:hypothetical protein
VHLAGFRYKNILLLRKGGKLISAFVLNGKLQEREKLLDALGFH